MKRSFWSLFTAVLMVWAGCGPARGDGGYVVRGELRPVEIPQQTAVLCFAQGVETLTIWNTVRAGEKPLAWVLPLPAMPDLIEECHPDGVRMIQMACGPDVDPGEVNLGLIAFNFLGVPLLILAGLPALRSGRRGLAAWVLAGVVGYGFVWFYFSAAGKIMGGPGAASEKYVEVLQSGQAGNYEIAVVRGDSGDALSDWLEAHGFGPLAGTGPRVVEDYASEGWVFVCARLKALDAGPASTHPLTVRFRTAEPVYPMRLTESAGTVPLDLFIVGEKWMSDPGGRLDKVGTAIDRRYRAFNEFWQGLWSVRESQNRGREYIGALPEEGSAREEAIANYGIPVVLEGRDALLDAVVSHGAKLTHLQGTFRPGGDWSDIRLVVDEVPVSGKKMKVYTREGLFGRVLMVGLPYAAMAFFLLANFGQGSRQPGALRRAGRAVTGMVAVFLVVAAVLGWDQEFVDSDRVIAGRKGQKGSFSGRVDSWLTALSAQPKRAEWREWEPGTDAVRKEP